MADKANTPDYYTLLGVPQKAHSDAIRKGFHKFARRYHPDNYSADDGDKRARATALYRLGTEAYRVLLNPTKRKMYDEGLAKGQLRYKATRAEEQRRTRPGGRRQMMKSSKARSFYVRAKQAMRIEDWAQAKLNLQLALQHETDSEELKNKLNEVLERLSKS